MIKSRDDKRSYNKLPKSLILLKKTPSLVIAYYLIRTYAYAFEIAEQRLVSAVFFIIL